MGANHGFPRRGSAPRLFTLFVCICWACWPAHGASPKRDELHIELDAASTEIDFRNNTAVLRKIVIREGDVRVEADEAAAAGGVDNFENNQWVLTGNVRIRMPNGALSADRAVVSFVDNRIVRAVITGTPAFFEQMLEETGDLARGRGRTIEYDVVGGTVRLEGEAYLTDGRNDITGPALVYSIRDQRVVTQGEGRVHITINPRSVEEQQEEEERKKARDEENPSATESPRP